MACLKIVDSSKIKSKINSALNRIYPIGCIYLSTISTNPGTLFGGTWTAWGTGRVPVGIDSSQSEFNISEKVGGHKSIQSHTHSFSATTSSNGSHQHNLIGADGANVTQSVTKNRVPGASGGSKFEHMIDGAGAHTHTISGTSGSYGSGNAQNLQPYIVCFMWKRTA